MSRGDEALGMPRICELGLTDAQVVELMGGREQEFNRWMYGQTMALCDEHGVIVYRSDAARFLDGGRVVD